MAVERLDERWQAWVEHNLSRGCDPEGMLEIMLVKHGFPVEDIRNAMGTAFPASSRLLADRSAEIATTTAAAPIDYQALTRVAITRGSFQYASDKLQLFMLEDFLSFEECDQLIAIINTRLRPSTITRPSADPEFRTSTTCDLSLIEDPHVTRLDQKIARAVGINVAYTEGNQGQRYDVGQQFKPHTDYFQPNTEEYQTFAKTRGNRTWTFMIFLNENCVGGGTHFVAIDKVFYPRKGRALAWNNLHADGSVNPNTRHCGLPVEQGCKLIVTKWFREKGAGQMFLT